MPERDDPSWDGENYKTVKLTGAFWGWGEPRPMARAIEEENVSLDGDANHVGGGGRYVAAMDLPPGRHEFKFVVEGNNGDTRWLCSRHYAVCGDSSGVENNFIDIE